MKVQCSQHLKSHSGSKRKKTPQLFSADSNDRHSYRQNRFSIALKNVLQSTKKRHLNSQKLHTRMRTAYRFRHMQFKSNLTIMSSQVSSALKVQRQRQRSDRICTDSEPEKLQNVCENVLAEHKMQT